MIKCVFKLCDRNDEYTNNFKYFKPKQNIVTQFMYSLADNIGMCETEIIKSKNLKDKKVYYDYAFRERILIDGIRLKTASDKFQRFWNKHENEVTKILNQYFPETKNKDYNFIPKVTMIKPNIFDGNSSFLVYYKYNAECAFENVIANIIFNLFKIHIKNLIITDYSKDDNQLLLWLLGNITVSLFFRNTDFAKFRVNYPYNPILKEFLLGDYLILETMSQIFLENSFDEYIKISWELLINNKSSLLQQIYDFYTPLDSKNELY